MRKIRTAEEIAKKQRLIKIIVGSVLIFLMVFSTAGFALNGLGGGSSSSSKSNDLEEVYFNGQYWVYTLEGQQFYFTNQIAHVSEIPLSTSVQLSDLFGKTIYLDSENQLVEEEIVNNLGRYIYGVQVACYGECELDLLERGCEENLIVFRKSEEKKVYQEEKCIFIEGDLSSVDAFLYEILGFF